MSVKKGLSFLDDGPLHPFTQLSHLKFPVRPIHPSCLYNAPPFFFSPLCRRQTRHTEPSHSTFRCNNGARVATNFTIFFWCVLIILHRFPPAVAWAAQANEARCAWPRSSYEARVLGSRFLMFPIVVSRHAGWGRVSNECRHTHAQMHNVREWETFYRSCLRNCVWNGQWCSKCKVQQDCIQHFQC